ncbi:LysR family transcriptional regulator [Gordonia sp. CPCC 205515]|uniref:LysR family transcriptional regulator n=1 Tax=Gordonia sp. CPCC 205515 TaxID=3140791 RepID=UPI003AF391D1
MAKLTLRQLELMAALPDYRTMSEAATALHVSESGLSQAVSEVERIVGEQLCVRRKAKGLQMTPAGQYFAQRSRRIVEEAGSLVDELSANRGEITGPIRVGCYVGFSGTILPPAVAHFAREHPRARVEVRVGGDDELLPEIHRGTLDFALLYDISLPADLNRRAIYPTEVTAALPADHRLAGRAAVSLTDLVDDPVILLDTAPSTCHTHRVFAEFGVSPTIRTLVPTIDLARAFIGRGMGYGLLMSRPHAPDMSPEGLPLVTLPLSPRTGMTNVVATWPQQMTLSPRAEALLDKLIETMASGAQVR